MRPRVPILSALRRGITSPKTSAAPLSTTAAPQDIRDISAPRPRGGSLLSLGPSSENHDGRMNLARDLYQTIMRPSRGNASERRQTVEQLADKNRSDDYMRQMTRRWRVGDVYSPHDLSPSEMSKWQRNSSRKQDVVNLLGLRPLDMYRNFSFISEFITPHGRIKRSSETGLCPVNQRKVAKAIRRSIGLGLHPSVHRHPEILLRGPSKTLAQNTAGREKTVKWH
ncbi:ribosomal protein S18 [Xylaria sp. CBS 124048]|nr:ribosomal protein S18 [Xylaria sp. CBS 124048]